MSKRMTNLDKMRIAAAMQKYPRGYHKLYWAVDKAVNEKWLKACASNADEAIAMLKEYEAL